MSSTSIRSPHRWVQEGFIPDFPLPEIPDKNVGLIGLLDAAKRWGCRIRQVNKSDYNISHQLASKETGFPRPEISVSSHRKEASQAVISFLRGLHRAVTQHLLEVASKAPIEDAVEPRIELTKARNDLVDQGVIVPAEKPAQAVQAPVAQPKTNGSPVRNWLNFDIRSALARVTESQYLEGKRFHYKDHAAERMCSFEDCAETNCLAVKNAIKSAHEPIIDAWAGMVAQYHNDIKAAERLLEETAAPVRQGKPASDEPFTMTNPIGASDPFDARKRKVQAFVMGYMEWLKDHWEIGHYISRRKIERGLLEVARIRGYSSEFVDTLLSGNIFEIEDDMMRVKVSADESSNTRPGIGGASWRDFVAATKVLRTKLRK